MITMPETMCGVVLTGHGGLDKLEWREDLPTPRPGPGEVVIKVAASSVNNTDVNTRVGWYSKTVRGDTAEAAAGAADIDAEDAAWSGEALAFPRIQGADVCGRIVAVGEGVDGGRTGERVLVRTLQTTGAAGGPFESWTFGSDCDGGFAEYAKTFARDAIAVSDACAWSDRDLGTVPCAFTTAEGMLQRASLKDERVLITGASGGVGAAAIQLAKRHGAHVTAMTSASKTGEVKALGADETVGRDDDFGRDAFDVVVDLVAGPRWPAMIDALRRGGRYVASGAIAGPIVELDIRTLYLRDLSLLGSTYQPDNILPDVIAAIEGGEITPMTAAAYPLKRLVEAQKAFLEKGFVGKIAIDVAS